MIVASSSLVYHCLTEPLFPRDPLYRPYIKLMELSLSQPVTAAGTERPRAEGDIARNSLVVPDHEESFIAVLWGLWCYGLRLPWPSHHPSYLLVPRLPFWTLPIPFPSTTRPSDNAPVKLHTLAGAPDAFARIDSTLCYHRISLLSPSHGVLRTHTHTCNLFASPSHLPSHPLATTHTHKLFTFLIFSF